MFRPYPVAVAHSAMLAHKWCFFQLITSILFRLQDSNPELEISAQRSDENHVCAEENWIRKVDGLGEPFYIHHKSGMTTYRKPNEEKPGVFKMCER